MSKLWGVHIGEMKEQEFLDLYKTDKEKLEQLPEMDL